MRQVFLSKSGQILVEEAPAPECGRGEVLVDVAYSLISSGTETASLAAASADLRERIERAAKLARLGLERLRERGLDELLRKARVREGISAPSGYSVSGIVRAVGEEVTDLRPGQAVAAAGSAYAHHAELVAVPRNLVVPVPIGVDLRDASFSTVGAIALQGVRRVSPQVGETVVVVGLGLIGQLTVQILAASGCRVVGVDPRRDRVELAGKGGELVAGSSADPKEVEAIVFDATGGIGADAVLLCAGTASDEPVATAMRIVRQRGRVVVVGAVGMKLERSPFYQKEVEFTISCSYGPGRYDPTYEEGGVDYPIGFVRWTENRNLQAFLDLLARGRLDIERLLASEHTLEDAPAAFRIAKEQPGAGVAVVLRYPETPSELARTIHRVTPPTRAAGPKLGLAVVGAGGFAASTLLPALAALPETALRVVVTRTSSQAAKVAEEFGAERASTSADETLRAADVDAVVIATRHDSHAELALAALAAGKHVFLEKPMGISRDEVDRLREAAERAGRVFTVGYNRRYAPLVGVVRDEIVRARGPAVIDYRVNAGPVPVGHWTVDPRVGGGRIIGELCHMLDLLRFLLGPDVESLACAGLGPRDGPLATPQEAAIGLRLRDAKGVAHVANLVYTSFGSPQVPKERIEIHAAGATLVLDDFAELQSFGGRARAQKLKRPDKGHRDQMRFFVEAVLGKETPLLGVEDAWAAADLSLRIDEALRA
ncbi:Glucose--fructose oxidoreductase [Myxococcaceae bacterium]|nr:Glucose--fructose oxidoreductase [Myxococcaceae bacterium]